ncbi:MAG: MFS transporter [Ignavibacteria bacterium]|jgi:DHA1 family multidrug resistance protein-like MFS transporter|nr:MFS transporter [Ignavibacteria bacterium]
MEFWKKNLYIIWAAQFITMAGMSMVVPFLPFYIRDLGITNPDDVEKWSGLVFAGPFVVSFFITPLWGALGDRWGKKAMILRAIIGLAVSQFLCGISQSAFELLLYRLFQGAASGFIPASLALVSSSTPKEKSGHSIGILQTAISAGTVVGPLLGGVIADMTSHRAVFFITGSLCLLSGVLIYILVKEPPNSISKESPNVLQNLKFAYNDGVLFVMLISIAIAQMSVSITQPGFALFIESMLEDKTYLSTTAGLLFGVTGIATAFSSPWWGKRNDRKGYRKNLTIAMAVGALALGLHAFVYSHLFLFPVRILLGICIGGMVPAFYSVINRNIPDERKGGVMGIASSSTILGNMLGPLVYSGMMFFTGIRYVFIFAGLLLLFNMIFIRTRKV